MLMLPSIKHCPTCVQAAIVSGRKDLLEMGRLGRDFVETVHYVAELDEYSFDVLDGKPADMTQQAYAYAFILSMHAAIRAAGISDDDSDVERIFGHLERKFYLGDAQVPPHHPMHCRESFTSATKFTSATLRYSHMPASAL